MSRKERRATPEGRVLREVRKAEINALEEARKRIDGPVTDTGTGQTILRLRQKPIAKLVDEDKIGPEELDAAEEISLALFALSSRLMVRGISYVDDRVDGGRRDSDAPWPALTAKAVSRYQKFANLWSDRCKQYGDPTLEIVVAAIIDETPLRAIAADVGYRVARVERALIGGLRDYAARAGLVSGHQSQRWMDVAEAVFAPPAGAKLMEAVRRARLERS